MAPILAVHRIVMDGKMLGAIGQKCKCWAIAINISEDEGIQI
jgi:hypothetical protein